MAKVKSKLNFLAPNNLLNFSTMLMCPVMAYRIPIGPVMVPRSIFHGLGNCSSYHTLTFVKHSRIPGRSTTLMMPKRRRSFLNCLCLMCLETNCLFGTNVIVIQLQSCKFLWMFYHSTIHTDLFASIISTKQKSSSETHCQNSFNSVINSKMTSKAPQIFWRSQNLNSITQYRFRRTQL